jgi:flagellar assembly factor FliW
MGLETHKEIIMNDDAVKAGISEETGQDEGKLITIETKYGSIDVNLTQALLFPYGLLGMPSNTDYVVTNFPKPNMDQFKLFQNLNDHELSFAVLPVATSSELFDDTDIEEACKVTDVDKDNLLILAIISVQRTVDEVKVTANMRAPLLIDTGRKMGVQYVFPSNKYDIRHLLSRTKSN